MFLSSLHCQMISFSPRARDGCLIRSAFTENRPVVGSAGINSLLIRYNHLYPWKSPPFKLQYLSKQLSRYQNFISYEKVPHYLSTQTGRGADPNRPSLLRILDLTPYSMTGDLTPIEKIYNPVPLHRQRLMFAKEHNCRQIFAGVGVVFCWNIFDAIYFYYDQVPFNQCHHITVYTK